MSDYLAVGVDGDSFRVPLSPNVAMQVADAFGAVLLTTKLSVDYSHGVRFVSEQVVVDGMQMQIAEVLKSSELHILFSKEGVLDLQEIRETHYRP